MESSLCSRLFLLLIVALGLERKQGGGSEAKTKMSRNEAKMEV